MVDKFFKYFADEMQVAAYDENEPSLTLSNGEVHTADVIIAADGEWPFETESWER